MCAEIRRGNGENMKMIRTGQERGEGIVSLL